MSETIKSQEKFFIGHWTKILIICLKTAAFYIDTNDSRKKLLFENARIDHFEKILKTIDFYYLF